MSSSLDIKKHWLHSLLTRRLTVSLFVILPVVFGLTAFASGFIALILVEHFLKTTNGPISISLVQEAMRYIRLEVLGFTLLGILVGFGVAFAILRPLKRMVNEAGKVASGELENSAPLEHLAELGPVGEDFHRVVSTLKQDLIDSIAWGWVMVSPSGHIAALNPGAEHILGIRATTWIGQPFQKLSEAFRVEGDFLETIGKSLKGTGQASGKVMEMVTADARSVRLSFTTTVLTGTQDQPLGVAVTFKDLTRSKEISEQMQRTDKLAAMGTLAACVAHEVRNPLGAIKGLAQLLDEAFEADDPHRSYTRTMIKEIDRLNEVVTHLVEFSQPSTGGSALCDGNELLERALFLGQVDSGPKEVFLEKNLQANLPKVWADGRKIIQALLNLLLNALDAVEPGGTIRVESAVLENGEDRAQVSLTIANTGSPLEKETQEHMFEPFFTTKKEGTGLGLAIAGQIVSAHGGSLKGESFEGWTRFTLQLPVGKSQHQAAGVQS